MYAFMLLVACSDYQIKSLDNDNIGGEYAVPEEAKTFGSSEEDETIEETIEEPIEEPIEEEPPEEEEPVVDAYTVALLSDGSVEFLYAKDFGWSSISEAHGWYDDLWEVGFDLLWDTRFVCGLNSDNIIECECVGEGDCLANDGMVANHITDKPYAQVSSGRRLLCGLDFDGQVDCWGVELTRGSITLGCQSLSWEPLPCPSHKQLVD